MYDEVEQHHKAKQHEVFIALGGDGEEEEESEEDEEGVFDLDVDTESSSGDDDDDDDDEDEDDDEDDEEEEGDSDDEPLRQRRQQQASSVERAGLLSDEEDEDEDEDEDEAAGARKVRQWGKHKQQYYNADATDLEIGQDFGDAEEEEAAAREVEQARYDEMDEEDYVDGLGGSEDDEDEEADQILSARLKKKNKQAKEGKKSKAALAPLLGDLSLLQGGVDERGDVETARVRKDLSKLSKAGKLQVLINDSPELLTLLEEFKEKLGELRDRVEPLVPLARQVRNEGGREGGREERRLQLSKPQAGIKAFARTTPTAANYVARPTVTYVLSYIPPEDPFPSLFLGPFPRFVFVLCFSL